MMTEEQVFQCPKCKHHNHKFYVNSEKGLCHCYHCDFGGKLSKLKEYPEIYSQVEDRETLAAYKRLEQNKIRQYKQNSELLKQLAPFHELSSEDQEFDYLLSRGWDEDILDCYEILVSENEKYKQRVFITISDNSNNTVFFTGRSILPDINPKYLNSVSKKDFVFQAKTPVDDFYTENAYIGEGIFDMFKLPGGLALLGKTMSRDQHDSVFAALRSRTKIYLCLDPGTVRESKILAQELNAWFPAKSIYILNWGSETQLDLGDLSQKMSRLDLMSFIQDNSFEYIPGFLK